MSLIKERDVAVFIILECLHKACEKAYNGRIRMNNCFVASDLWILIRIMGTLTVSSVMCISYRGYFTSGDVVRQIFATDAIIRACLKCRIIGTFREFYDSQKSTLRCTFSIFI